MVDLPGKSDLRAAPATALRTGTGKEGSELNDRPTFGSQKMKLQGFFCQPCVSHRQIGLLTWRASEGDEMRWDLLRDGTRSVRSTHEVRPLSWHEQRTGMLSSTQAALRPVPGMDRSWSWAPGGRFWQTQPA